MTSNMPARAIMAVANLPFLNTGMGGHYHSTRVILAALREHMPVDLMVIGHVMPSALSEIENTTLIQAGSSPSLNTVLAIRRAIKSRRVEVVHCMDSSSLLFARLATVGTGVPVIWTKCGGRSLRRYTPLGSPDTVFHSADYDLYRTRGYHPQLIPNRVEIGLPPAPREERASVDGPLRLVRISRICAKYESGLAKTVSLAHHSVKAGVPCHLDIIGHLEDPMVLSRLQALAGPETRFFTTPDWTVQASRRLPEYDVAIGCGRAAMEALAAGLPTFTTPDQSAAPVLINSMNFDVLLDANISERAPCEGTMKEAISRLSSLSDPAEYEAHRRWATAISLSRLDVRSGVEKYLRVYRDAVKKPARGAWRDLAHHLCRHQLGVLRHMILHHPTRLARSS